MRPKIWNLCPQPCRKSPLKVQKSIFLFSLVLHPAKSLFCILSSLYFIYLISSIYRIYIFQKMPKIRRTRKKAPEGYELIEETLNVSVNVQKNKNILRKWKFLFRNWRLKWKKPKMTHMRESEKSSRSGQCLKFITRGRDTFLTSSIKEKQSL